MLTVTASLNTGMSSANNILSIASHRDTNSWGLPRMSISVQQQGILGSPFVCVFLSSATNNSSPLRGGSLVTTWGCHEVVWGYMRAQQSASGLDLTMWHLTLLWGHPLKTTAMANLRLQVTHGGWMLWKWPFDPYVSILLSWCKRSDEDHGKCVLK